MKSKTIKILKILLVILIILVFILLSILIIRNIYNKKMIEKISEAYDTNNDFENDIEESKIKVNGNAVLGVLKIDKIKFEGLVYEGTSDDILKKGVGHFDTSPIFEGNACFAAHNYSKFWAKLHTLQAGDVITYKSYLGKMIYKVSNIIEIDETDWSFLENSNENKITLITCVRKKPSKRLCVQAFEEK